MAENMMYLTLDENPNGPGLVAIITMGHPQHGDIKCTVLTLEVVADEVEALRWYDRMKVERPWEARQ